MAEMKMCEKCGRMKNADTQFYQYRNGEKTELCKDCLTMHIDNFDPETFLWLLEKMDVPYIPEEWNVIRDKAFAKNPILNGMSVFGKYLSKMKLKQYKGKGWADSAALQAEREYKNKISTEERQKYDEELKEKMENGEITEAEFKTLASTPSQKEDLLMHPERYIPGGDSSYANPDSYIDESLLEDGIDLTDEDKIYLATKWGRTYKPYEWVQLEKTYNDMMESFDIQDADSIHTLIHICKTDLKMNQAIDCSDFEGYQKLSKVSNDLRKSAKFTAAQNKEKKDDYVDSIGQLVSMCEREGFIPRYATDIPQDKVDATLKDMNEYVKKLVTQDLGFGQQIEDSIRKIQIQKEMEQNADQDLTDEDFAEYYNDVEQQREQDYEALEEDGDE